MRPKICSGNHELTNLVCLREGPKSGGERLFPEHQQNKDSALFEVKVFKFNPCSQCRESGQLQFKDSQSHSLETWGSMQQVAGFSAFKQTRPIGLYF